MNVEDMDDFAATIWQPKHLLLTCKDQEKVAYTLTNGEMQRTWGLLDVRLINRHELHLIGFRIGQCQM